MTPSVIDRDGSLGCSVARLRGELEHDELKNTYLFLDPATLAEELLRDGEQRVAEMRQRLEGFVRLLPGYSPRVLVERLEPFADLAPEQRSALVQSLEEAFQRGFHPACVAARLERPIQAFLEAQDRFVGEARSRRDGEDAGEGTPFARAHEALVEAARGLRAELLRLPRGVWLP